MPYRGGEINGYNYWRGPRQTHYKINKSLINKNTIDHEATKKTEERITLWFFLRDLCVAQQLRGDFLVLSFVL